MKGKGNLLIVEDEKEWCDAYARAAAREGVETVRVATDLASAEHLIDDMQFAVAIVDIGLNVGDDQNVDGLSVMKKIRAVGDSTSVVVVTGRSGKDVLTIARDSIVKYGAYEIVAKADIEPQDIRELLNGGISEFNSAASAARVPAHKILSGNLDSWLWDDQVIKATRGKIGAKQLYPFLERLIAEFLPIIAKRAGEPAVVEASAGVVHGSYWSRSIGQGIAICFGDRERAALPIESATGAGKLLDKYDVSSVLRHSSAEQLEGAVFTLRGARREDFGGG